MITTHWLILNSYHRRPRIGGLKAIFKPGYRFAKAGVMLLDLQDSDVEHCELDLDDPGADRSRRSRLMTTMDALNMRYGRGSVQLASAGLAGDTRRWAMRPALKTPDYTTRWSDMPRARAKAG